MPKLSICHRYYYENTPAGTVCKKCQKPCRVVWRSMKKFDSSPGPAGGCGLRVISIKKLFITPLRGEFDRSDQSAVMQNAELRALIFRKKLEHGAEEDPGKLVFVIADCIREIKTRIPRYRNRFHPSAEIKRRIIEFISELRR